MFSEPPSLNHLKKMTTSIGIIQHSLGSEPDLRYGYSIDDSARALIVSLQYHELYGNDELIDLAKIYLGYLAKAQLPNGYFHNFSDFRGVFVDKQGSADSLGRVIWALGSVMNSKSADEELKKDSYLIYKKIPLSLGSLLHLRSKAFALIGFALKGDLELAKLFAEDINLFYLKNSKADWDWFENKMTYANAILPYSLLVYADKSGDKTSMDTALASLNFLLSETTTAKMPVPIGQDGWYSRSKEKALFDQQVVDVADTILACVEAFRLTDKKIYIDTAENWFTWFNGNNLGKQIMVDLENGGVYDGLKAKSVNKNQGAESVVCYLMAHLSLARVKKTTAD